jgi:hypothetical protein
MYSKFKEELTNILIAQVNLIDDDYKIVIELVLLTFNIKSEVVVFWNFFFSIFLNMKKSHHVIFDVKP